MNKLFIFFLFLIIVGAGTGLYFYMKPGDVQIKNFEDCTIEGNPILEIYPRQCRTSDGQLFTEDIGNELEKRDLIFTTIPRPNQVVSSPLLIEGEARGFWYFEADFPIKIYDASGNELGVAIAQAQSDWLTEKFVPFSATLNFNVPTTEKGKLVLEKDNPSGISEYADQLEIPIIFKQ
ncbi:Gmad2 immunoglobulin-like domain-containing protein [Patescibacteria group bacterium]